MSSRRTVNPLYLLAVLAILLALAAGLWVLAFAGRVSTDNAYLKSDVTLLSPKVTGYITQVAVGDNQKVAAGEVLFRIDPTDFEARLAQAQAQQEAATRQVDAQKSLIAQANANATKATRDLTRARALVPEGAIAPKRLDDAQAAATATRAAAAAAAAQLEVLAAQVQQAMAAVQLAQIDLSNTTVVAPRAGTVGNRTAQVGQLVRPGAALAYLIPENIWVEANFKETQLPGMKAGQPATIEVDALGDTPLHGHVESFAPASGSEFSLLPPENATGNFTKIVRRVPVKLVFDASTPLPQGLKPGLSAVVTVDMR